MRKHTVPGPRYLVMIALLTPFGLAQTPAHQPSQPPASASLPPAAPAAVVTSAGAEHPADATAPLTEDQGDSFLARGRYLAAIRSYEGAQPKTASTYNKLGIACEHMRLNDRARENFNKALQIDPKFAEVYNNLGTLAHTEGDYRHAEKYYKKAIKLNPKSPDAHKNLGTLYYARGKYGKGDQSYHQAHELDKDIFARSSHAPIQATTDPKNTADLHYHLAKTYAKAGSDQMALEYLRKAIGEGFRDKRRLLTDQEFAALWNTPAFMKIVEDLKMN